MGSACEGSCVYSVFLPFHPHLAQRLRGKQTQATSGKSKARAPAHDPTLRGLPLSSRAQGREDEVKGSRIREMGTKWEEPVMGLGRDLLGKHEDQEDAPKFISQDAPT